MSNSLYWCGRKIGFIPGEMLAYTLLRACEPRRGIGKSAPGQTYGLFCGIGACQGCLVNLQGRGTVESCLTPSSEGMRVVPVDHSDDQKARAAGECDDD